MTTTPNILHIDREAAAEWLSSPDGGMGTLRTAKITAGQWDDHPLVQAFARHRQNTIPDTHDERERIASYLRDVLTMDRCCAATLRQCADAVERGDHLTQTTEDKSDA